MRTIASQTTAYSNVSSTVCSFTRTTVRISKPLHQFPLVRVNHRCLVGSTNKGQVMTSSILTKMFVCMGFLCAVWDACEFDDDLIRHFRVIRRAQCMNSQFAMNHITLPSLIMPQLVPKRLGATKHLKMSSTKRGPFCPGEMSLKIYVFRLTHPIDIILFRHLRYDVITWKHEGSTGQRRIHITKGW